MLSGITFIAYMIGVPQNQIINKELIICGISLKKTVAVEKIRLKEMVNMICKITAQGRNIIFMLGMPFKIINKTIKIAMPMSRFTNSEMVIYTGNISLGKGTFFM
jgi:hypothetical protein